jgi:hypothetical protein
MRMRRVVVTIQLVGSDRALIGPGQIINNFALYLAILHIKLELFTIFDDQITTG